MMRRADMAQRGSFPPWASTRRVLLALAAALVAVALVVASHRVGSLYSPTTLLLGPAPHPALLNPYGEAVFYAMGGQVVPQE